MDTSVEVIGTDKLGRRNGPRRKYTNAEKRTIAEETLRPGASVAVVAHRHGVNANLLFGWRRLLKQGLLSETAPSKAAPLLPVKVSTPTLVPNQRAKVPVRKSPASDEGSWLEIEFTGGQRLRIHGRADRPTLTYVIATLSRR
ncbi:MAG TPA: transposase [Steroidobacteraceae bacterium]|jgi:transposase|nr:transposase [Steroidobacteraceae bacterium]